MDYFYKFRSTVTQVAAQVSNALPGNPLTREYEVGDLIATAGLGLHWKIYSGIKKSTKQPVAVWLLDKKELDKALPSKELRETFLSTVKIGVSQLTRLRHPRLLVVEHGIEESRDSLAYATEPIFSSLANCLGRRDHLMPVPHHLHEFSLLEIEIKHGLFQLAEALTFLHIDARIMHRNICPENVIISDKGAWKLAGFDFACTGIQSTGNQVAYEKIDWKSGESAVLPSLNYIAPEMISGTPSPNADIFSLGILTYSVFNKCKTPFEHRDNMRVFDQNMNNLKSMSIPPSENVPAVFKDDYKMCLNYSPELRPDANQFTRMAYFEDSLMKLLNCFESLMQMDNNQKMQFFKSLPPLLVKFEKRPLLQKVLPWLTAEFATPDLIPFILPAVFLIVEKCTKQEFTTAILPPLIPVFSMERPYQIALLLLQQMELFLEKANDSDVKQHILPLIYSSISTETVRIQELCLTIVPTIGKLVDRNSMKTQLLPKLLKLATDGNVLAIRVQALVCVGKLLPTLESWMITELILPALPKISSKEPGLLMASLGIYKLAFESENVAIGREQLAKSVLPFLIATCVENTLNLNQFEQFISLSKSMLAKVETEQRSRLKQLSVGQEEQRGGPNLADVLKPSSILSPDLSGLEQSLSGVSGAGSRSSTPSNNSTGSGMSLEEKRRIAAKQAESSSSQTPKTLNAMAAANQPMNSNTVGIGMGMGATAQAASTSKSNPLDDLLRDGFTASAKTSHGVVDVSDFMPSLAVPAALSQTRSTGVNVNPVQQNNFAFPIGNFASSSSSAQPSMQKQFGNMSLSGGSGFLPQPPQSSNAAIVRPTATSSANPLDSLFSFPNKQPSPSLNAFSLPAPPQTAKVTPKANDPFADLLS